MTKAKKRYKTFEIKAETLWNNTYSHKRANRPQPEWFELGLSHKATAKAIFENPEVPIEALPLYPFMKGAKYKRIQGHATPIKRINTYLKIYKKVLENIRRQGYNTELSRIRTIKLSNGKYVIRDGHRRLNSIITISKQKTIEVLAPSKSL